MKTLTQNLWITLATLSWSASLLVAPSSGLAETTNQVLSMDGSSGYVSVPQSADLNLTSGDFSITAWVFLKAYDPWGSAILIKRVPGSGNGWVFLVSGLNQVGVARKVAFGVSENADPTMFSNSDLKTNEWHHLAVVYKAANSNASIYVDGMLDASAVIRPPLATTADLFLGRDSITSQYFWNGFMDEVCVWNRALTSNEVTTRLHCELSGAESGLVAYWNFDGGTLGDQTGHGHNGAASGNAAIVPMSGSDVIHAGCGLVLNIRVSQVELCWDTMMTNWYQLQYKSSLTTNQWVPFMTNWIAGDGSRFCTNDAVLSDQAHKFYRIAVTNSPPQ